MADLGKAYVQIVPSAEGIEGSITELLGGEVERAGSEGGKKLGLALKLGMGAAIAGLGALVKGALDEGGNLQQSYLGGLDTLYGDAADAARQYAREAAAAGISMNTYSEQAVSFGAALKSAYGGDVTQAAEAANTAILDMADNSAKMGTDIEAVQSAYQGFAKQNYTMLDNLKLGYGGTKTEMERLLQDATKLSGIEYNIDNLGDVYAAIHVIQEDLGLTGVAAEEAAGTLTGSAAAIQASWSNLLGSMALGEDITPALTQLVTSVTDFLFNNLIPMVGNVLLGLPQAIGQAIETGLPLLIEKGSTMLDSLITGLQTGLPQVISQGMQFVVQMGQGLLQSVPDLMAKAGQLVGALVQGLIASLPSLIAGALRLAKAAFEAFRGINWLDLGINIITGIVKGLAAAGSQIADYLIELAKSALDSIKSFFGIKSPSRVMAQEVGKWIPLGIVKGIEDNVKPLTNEMQSLADLTTASATADITSAATLTASRLSAGIDTNSNNALLDRLNTMVSLMAEYYPDMAKDTVIDGDSLVNGMDRALGLRTV